MKKINIKPGIHKRRKVKQKNIRNIEKELYMKKQDEKTLVLLSLVCLIFALIFKSATKQLIIASLAFQFINLFVPPLDRMITKGWLKFSEVIGKFNTKIILTIIWYFFLVPLAFIKKKQSNEDLLMKNPEDKESFWIEHNIEINRENLKKVW